MKTMENRKRGSVGEHQGVAMKKGWPMKTLGEVCEVFADGDWVESKDQSSEGIRLIQTGNVGERCAICWRLSVIIFVLNRLFDGF